MILYNVSVESVLPEQNLKVATSWPRLPRSLRSSPDRSAECPSPDRPDPGSDVCALVWLMPSPPSPGPRSPMPRSPLPKIRRPLSPGSEGWGRPNEDEEVHPVGWLKKCKGSIKCMSLIRLFCSDLRPAISSNSYLYLYQRFKRYKYWGDYVLY